MFLQMVNIERRKLSKRTMFWVELAIIILAVFLLFTAFYGIQATDFSQAGPNVQVEGDPAEFALLLVWPMGLTVGFNAVSLLGAFLLIILTGALVAQEYSWGTFQIWLSRGVPRPSVLLAKFLIAAAVTFLFVLTAVITGTIISAIFSQMNLGSLPFDSVNWLRLVQSVLLVSFSILPYVALAFFLAVLSRSTIVTIGGTLAFASLIEPVLSQIGMLVGGAWQSMVAYLPANLGQRISLIILEIPKTSELPDIVSAPENMLSLETAVIAVTIYTVLFIAASIILFQRQDLGG